MAQRVDDKILELIQQADWDDIYPRAMKYALSKLSLHSGSPLSGMPKKQAAHDIVSKAILKIIEGDRRWNPDRGPLLGYLLSVIKSDISHLYESEEYLSTSRMPETGGTAETDPSQSPEEAYFENEMRDSLLKAVEGDDELESIVLCMLDGFEKPGDIARQIGVETRVVNNAQKRLQRIYEGILPRINEEGT